jgi:hypothetical protein
VRTANLWRRFEHLLPTSPLLVGEVTDHNIDGTSTILLPGGGSIRAHGQIVAVEQQAYVQDSRVLSEASVLSAIVIEV